MSGCMVLWTCLGQKNGAAKSWVEGWIWWIGAFFSRHPYTRGLETEEVPEVGTRKRKILVKKKKCPGIRSDVSFFS